MCDRSIKGSSCESQWFVSACGVCRSAKLLWSTTFNPIMLQVNGKQYSLICEYSLPPPQQLYFSFSINMTSCIPSVDWCWLKHVKGIKEQWELNCRPTYTHTLGKVNFSPLCVYVCQLACMPQCAHPWLSVPGKEHIIYKISQIIVSRLTISFWLMLNV